MIFVDHVTEQMNNILLLGVRVFIGEEGKYNGRREDCEKQLSSEF